MPAKKPSTAKKPVRKRRKKVAPKSTGLDAIEVAEKQPTEGTELASEIESDGGRALAIYREPLGGHTVVLASLPLELVEPTPYQRDLSEPHVKRLASAMERVGRYLDPLIAVRRDGKYWTPNGNHRLGASKLLGTKAIIALVLPEPDVAYQILALNTEKAHNLKERSLEVIRMYRGLTGSNPNEPETQFAPLFEEPPFITLGICYEKRPRFSGGAYHSIVKRLEEFRDEPLEESLPLREARADKLLELDDQVARAVANLKEKGLTSPYLKYFVVARVNFLRFKRDGELDFDETIDKMLASARKFDASKIKNEDISKMGGGPVEAEEA